MYPTNDCRVKKPVLEELADNSAKNRGIRQGGKASRAHMLNPVRLMNAVLSVRITSVSLTFPGYSRRRVVSSWAEGMAQDPVILEHACSVTIAQ